MKQRLEAVKLAFCIGLSDHVLVAPHGVTAALAIALSLAVQPYHERLQIVPFAPNFIGAKARFVSADDYTF
jgi:hypothetical protein